jgi:phosphoribosylanthranilate isomerase
MVKICGVVRPQDAELSAAAGADAIGINFWPRSKRFIGSLEAAREVVRAAGDLLVVGVFVNAALDEVQRALEVVELAQLHGDETPEYAAKLGRRFVRAVRLGGPEALAELESFQCDWYLCDALSPGYGGHGARCDWTLAAQAARRKRVVLAGGLGPDDVAQAIQEVAPFGVDTASGVEVEPGIKDPDKVRRFVAAVRAAAPSSEAKQP